MTYNPAIPGPNDLLSTSQSQIQTNFAQADSIFDVDHFTFDSANSSNRGKHRKITMVEWPQLPYVSVDPPTALDEVALYTKDVSTITQLFLRRANNGTIIQLTPPLSGDPSPVINGQSFLPGGVIIKWGKIGAAVNNVIQNFPSPFPAACFVVLVTIDIGSTVSPVGVNGFTDTGFTFRTTAAGGVPITYVAIGN